MEIKVEEETNDLLLNKFKFHANNLTEKQKEKSLLKPQIGFKAVDLFALYMELEKQFDIFFDEENVIANRFDIYNNMVAAVKKHVQVQQSKG